MKIDLKQFEGRELGAEDTEDRKQSLWEAYGGASEGRSYGWIVAVVLLVIAGLCAAISWVALVKFLAFCGLTILLLGGAVAWIDHDSRPFI